MPNCSLERSPVWHCEDPWHKEASAQVQWRGPKAGMENSGGFHKENQHGGVGAIKEDWRATLAPMVPGETSRRWCTK